MSSPAQKMQAVRVGPIATRLNLRQGPAAVGSRAPKTPRHACAQNLKHGQAQAKSREASAGQGPPLLGSAGSPAGQKGADAAISPDPDPEADQLAAGRLA